MEFISNDRNELTDQNITLTENTSYWLYYHAINYISKISTSISICIQNSLTSLTVQETKSRQQKQSGASDLVSDPVEGIFALTQVLHQLLGLQESHTLLLSLLQQLVPQAVQLLQACLHTGQGRNRVMTDFIIVCIRASDCISHSITLNWHLLAKDSSLKEGAC